MRLVCTPTTCSPLHSRYYLWQDDHQGSSLCFSDTFTLWPESVFLSNFVESIRPSKTSFFVVGWRVLIYDRRASGARLNPPFDDVILRLTLAIPSHAGALHCNIFLICSPRELKCSMNAHTRAEMLNGRTPQRWDTHWAHIPGGAEMLTGRTHQSELRRSLDSNIRAEMLTGHWTHTP
jgi:hypothetical protein